MANTVWPIWSVADADFSCGRYGFWLWPILSCCGQYRCGQYGRTSEVGWMKPKTGVTAFSRYLDLHFGCSKWFEILFSVSGRLVMSHFSTGGHLLLLIPITGDWNFGLGSLRYVLWALKYMYPKKLLGSLQRSPRLPSWGGEVVGLAVSLLRTSSPAFGPWQRGALCHGINGTMVNPGLPAAGTLVAAWTVFLVTQKTVADRPFILSAKINFTNFLYTLSFQKI